MGVVSETILTRFLALTPSGDVLLSYWERLTNMLTNSLDTCEAKTLLASELRKYRSQSYAELRSRINSQDTYIAVAPSGKEYQVEVGFLWDDMPDGNIRVMGPIDDGTPRGAMLPLTESFILNADRNFIGE
jgi:hypothetical protein